jgi:DnaJ-domain-containing protein 1
MASDPFLALGLQPFLNLSLETEKKLRAHVLQLSRNYHPDRIINGSEKDREEAESKSAEINQSWRIAQNAWLRLDWVLKSEVGPHKTQGESALPELAMEYFSLQEALEELDSEKADDESREISETADKLLRGFAVELSEKLAALELDREKISQPYTLEWEKRRSALWPPSPADLERLLALYQQKNYIKRMLENLNIDFNDRLMDALKDPISVGLGGDLNIKKPRGSL